MRDVILGETPQPRTKHAGSRFARRTLGESGGYQEIASLRSQ